MAHTVHTAPWPAPPGRHLIVFEAAVRFQSNNPSVLDENEPLHVPYWLAVYAASLLIAWALTRYFELPCARALARAHQGRQ